jgi:hypothetical protein
MVTEHSLAAPEREYISCRDGAWILNRKVLGKWQDIVLDASTKEDAKKEAARVRRKAVNARQSASLLQQAESAFYSAQRNAKSSGVLFSLTKNDVLEMFARGGRKCALTGIPFSLERVNGSRRRPFIPSIDRIDSKGGYTADNVRLVIWAMNPPPFLRRFLPRPVRFQQVAIRVDMIDLYATICRHVWRNSDVTHPLDFHHLGAGADGRRGAPDEHQG